MTINQDEINEMGKFQNKIGDFIKDISTPIKKQHSGNIEKYLDKFIKFPGSISVISVFLFLQIWSVIIL